MTHLTVMNDIDCEGIILSNVIKRMNNEGLDLKQGYMSNGTIKDTRVLDLYKQIKKTAGPN